MKKTIEFYCIYDRANGKFLIFENGWDKYYISEEVFFSDVYFMAMGSWKIKKGAEAVFYTYELDDKHEIQTYRTIIEKD